MLPLKNPGYATDSYSDACLIITLPIILTNSILLLVIFSFEFWNPIFEKCSFSCTFCSIWYLLSPDFPNAKWSLASGPPPVSTSEIYLSPPPLLRFHYGFVYIWFGSGVAGGGARGGCSLHLKNLKLRTRLRRAHYSPWWKLILALFGFSISQKILVWLAPFCFSHPMWNFFWLRYCDGNRSISKFLWTHSLYNFIL